MIHQVLQSPTLAAHTGRQPNDIGSILLLARFGTVANPKQALRKLAMAAHGVVCRTRIQQSLHSHVGMQPKESRGRPNPGRSVDAGIDRLLSGPLGDDRKHLAEISSEEHDFTTERLMSERIVFRGHEIPDDPIDGLRTPPVAHPRFVPQNDGRSFDDLGGAIVSAEEATGGLIQSPDGDLEPGMRCSPPFHEQRIP